MVFASHDWRLALATVVLAGLIDVTFGEPPSAVHPVVWMGRLVGALERRRPHGRPRAEFAYGVLIVLVTAGAAAAAGLLLTAVLAALPWWAALPIGAWVLKTTFALRGLVAAGRDVQRALMRDTTAARARLKALVSRAPDLDPPLIVSAAVESLAENLTDSVVSPLLYFALLGLPGALAYRAVNTMDAMIGYRDEREYVGKAAARADDALELGADAPGGAAPRGGGRAQGHGPVRLDGAPHAASAGVRTQQDAGDRHDGRSAGRSASQARRLCHRRAAPPAVAGGHRRGGHPRLGRRSGRAVARRRGLRAPCLGRVGMSIRAGRGLRLRPAPPTARLRP